MPNPFVTRAATAWLCVAVGLLIGRPAEAQIDLSGEWGATFHEDLQHRGGVRLGDYTGLPLNEAGWRKAYAWDEAARSTPERQCIPHVGVYALRGPATIRFVKVIDPVSGQLQAYSLHGSYGRPRIIWTDGRPHPSELTPHTWGGFSTGRWERNMLVVYTTHNKSGWLLRNGAPTSDLATMREYFTRYGDNLMVVSFIDDPVFLAEPLIRSTNFVLSLTANANAWGNCGPAQIVDQLGGRPKGYVPHYLPGQTDHIKEFVARSGIPMEAARGGAETTYPEFALRLRQRLGSEVDPRNRAPRELAESLAARADKPSRPPDDIEVVPVQGKVYLLTGAGGNIAVQVGDDGVLLVDTGSGKMTEKVLAAVRRLSDKPIRIILNTHAHPDHMGGNDAVAKAGRAIAGGRAADSPRPGALVFAHEAVLATLSNASGPSTPTAALPTEGYPGESKEVFLNDEAIQLIHPSSAAHTDGDSLVFFRRSDVIATGDIFMTTSYPVLDVSMGGSLDGVIEGLNRIIDIAIPKDWQEGGTMIIPGHGRIGDEADVVEYRDMVTIIRERIEDLIKKGMTLEQVKAARTTFEYDGRYGALTGAWTTDMFVEAAYRDLSRRSDLSRR